MSCKFVNPFRRSYTNFGKLLALSFMVLVSVHLVLMKKVLSRTKENFFDSDNVLEADTRTVTSTFKSDLNNLPPPPPPPPPLPPPLEQTPSEKIVSKTPPPSTSTSASTSSTHPKKSLSKTPPSPPSLLSCATGIVALTYASHGGKDDRFCRAVESAIQHRVPLRILGWGEPWQGLSQKLQGSLAAMKAYDDECVIVFTDAYDVLYSSGLDAVKAKHEEMNSPVLFSGECGCWPQIQRDKGKGDVCLIDYPTSPTPYRYLNSGQWIMKKKDALPIFQALIDEAHVYATRYDVPVSAINDQEMVSDMYMEGRFKIQLDSTNAIFQAMHATHARPLKDCDPWKEMRVDEGAWKNTVYNTEPSIFHFNGNGKSHHLEMESKMWYKPRSEAGNENSGNNKVYGKRLVLEEIRDVKLDIGVGEGHATLFSELCPNYGL